MEFIFCRSFNFLAIDLVHPLRNNEKKKITGVVVVVVVVVDSNPKFV